MKNLRKIFEAEDNYTMIRKHYSVMEPEFAKYDPIISNLNTFYDNVKITHRGNEFYDIKYNQSHIKSGVKSVNNWINIGVYDIKAEGYYLWVAKRLNQYILGASPIECKTIFHKGKLDDYGFERFLNEWYDIYDKL